MGSLLTFLARIIILLSFWVGGQAFAKTFLVDLGAVGKVNGVLEISPVEDPKKVLVSLALGSSRRYELQFPNGKDGVYMLAVRVDNKLVWREYVYILISAPENDKLLKASWRQDSESTRTVIKVQNPKGQLQYGVSIRDRIYLRLRSAPRLVRVFNELPNGQLTPAQDLQMTAMSEKEARSEAAPAEVPEKPLEFEPGAADDDQTSYEPEWKGLLAGKEDTTWRQKIMELANKRALPPLNRKTRVSVNLRILQESFSVQRSGSSYEGDKSQGFGSGFAANVVFKELMTFQLEADTHGTRTDYERGGVDMPAAEQKRIHARLGPLMDILNTNHSFPNASFEFGPVIGYNQIPLEKDNQGKMEVGLALRTQYFAAQHTEAIYRLFRSHSWDLDVNWTGSTSIATLNPLFGLYVHHTEFESGAATSRFNEIGIRFGMSKSF